MGPTNQTCHRLNFHQIAASHFRTSLTQTLSCTMLAGGVTSGEGGWKARERARRQAAVECALCVCVWREVAHGSRRGWCLATIISKCCRRAFGCVLAAQWSSGDICESSRSLKLACSSHSAHVLGSRIFRNRVLNKIYRTFSPLLC